MLESDTCTEESDEKVIESDFVVVKVEGKSREVRYQLSSVQFSFISAPPHEQNNRMLRSLCVVKDGVRKRKKQQNELRL